MPGFTKEQARAARQADLSAFLLRNDPGHYVREGKSLRLIDPSRPKRDRRKSISIKIGTNWWHDFATGETGNCVEYLTKRMGYSLVDAILALSDGAYVPAPSLSASAGLANADLQEEKRLEFPEAAKGSSLPMYDYLSGRGIPAWMIRHLEEQKLLYLSGRYNNLVFINRERDFADAAGLLYILKKKRKGSRRK